MTLVKRKPWGQFFTDPFFEEFPGMSTFFERESDELFPAINIIDDGKDYVMELAAPGYKKNDFNIDVENGRLIIKAENKEEMKKEEKNYKRKEFSFRSFERSFPIPDNIDEKSIQAKYDDGVLHLKLDKLELPEKENKRKIEVK